MQLEFKFIYLEEHDAILNKYPNIEDFDSWILTFASEGFTYGEIQKIMGNPSKKKIRQILLKYNPELLNDRSK